MVRTMRLNRPLYEAARYGEIKAIKLTISAVVDIDDDSSSAGRLCQQQEPKNRTPLFFSWLGDRASPL